ncbi:LysM domain-containing protein [Seinonella peptonophila]|uniref:LysM domain-containing protein n=1 Tax=Seinonella peptonophila TaxID=112248 RepID=A0A1M4TSB5_9BACL|nr:LysM domain-containing protein [Seinonella peptonophila]SHE47308.1 LysM domain-containing protein [Seinonella peptonophila]
MKIHVARENETLWELATQYNVPISRLIEINPKLSEDQPLQSGYKVKIPTGKVPILQAEPREKRMGTNRKEKVRHHKEHADNPEYPIEIPSMPSPEVEIDPEVFFMEQGKTTQRTSKDVPSYPDQYYHYPRMPLYMPPPYVSYYPPPIYPYPWASAYTHMFEEQFDLESYSESETARD